MTHIYRPNGKAFCVSFDTSKFTKNKIYDLDADERILGGRGVTRSNYTAVFYKRRGGNLFRNLYKNEVKRK